MAYSLEEQETIVNYDVQTKTWHCWSAFPTHITALKKLAHAYNVPYTLTHENCIKLQLPRKAIKFVKPVSAARKEQLQNNAVKMLEKRQKFIGV